MENHKKKIQCNIPNGAQAPQGFLVRGACDQDHPEGAPIFAPSGTSTCWGASEPKLCEVVSTVFVVKSHQGKQKRKGSKGKSLVLKTLQNLKLHTSTISLKTTFGQSTRQRKAGLQPSEQGSILYHSPHASTQDHPNKNFYRQSSTTSSIAARRLEKP